MRCSYQGSTTIRLIVIYIYIFIGAWPCGASFLFWKGLFAVGRRSVVSRKYFYLSPSSAPSSIQRHFQVRLHFSTGLSWKRTTWPRSITDTARAHPLGLRGQTST